MSARCSRGSYFRLIVVFTPLEVTASSNQREMMVFVWV
jgi:hypothetical protein